MKDSAQHIIEILFGREKLEDVTVNQLKDLVKEYPSFNIGHYLLSKKLQAENNEEFLPETKKTALYINNPYWLQWLLQQVNDEPIVHPEPGHFSAHPKATFTFNPRTEPFDLLNKSNIIERPPRAEEIKSNTTPFEQLEPVFKLPDETPFKPSPKLTVESTPVTALEPRSEPTAYEPADRAVELPAESATLKPDEPEFEQPVEFTYSTPVDQESKPEDKNMDRATESIIDDKQVSETREAIEEILPSATKLPETTEPIPSSEPFKEPVIITENKVEPTVKIEETKLGEIIFDPYHTIDYFASQGIKFVQEENPSDKLGKQLKSFTDWLKIMKRLPQKAIDATIDESREADVEIRAAHSIEEKDVITEAMAEVLAKQGKNEKAIEIYQKLSLLEPGKSYYFANKIEELKKPNS